MNLNHYRSVFHKILSTPYPYSKFQLLLGYGKLIVRSAAHHKLSSKSSVYTIKTIRLMGWSVRFRSYPQLITLVEEIFIFQVYHFTSNTPHPLIVDCGSNIGLSILYFKTLYPQCTLIAFEPDPDAFQLLQENIKRNHLTHITLHNLAVRSQSTETVLHQKSPGDITTSVFKTDATTNPIVTTSCRLSDYLSFHVDLVKLDVEGSETEILKDLVNTSKLRTCEKFIIEFHPRLTGISTADVDQAIITQGFTRLNRLPMSNGDEIVYYQRQ